MVPAQLRASVHCFDCNRHARACYGLVCAREKAASPFSCQHIATCPTTNTLHSYQRCASATNPTAAGFEFNNNRLLAPVCAHQARRAALTWPILPAKLSKRDSSTPPPPPPLTGLTHSAMRTKHPPSTRPPSLTSPAHTLSVLRDLRSSAPSPSSRFWSSSLFPALYASSALHCLPLGESTPSASSPVVGLIGGAAFMPPAHLRSRC